MPLPFMTVTTQRPFCAIGKYRQHYWPQRDMPISALNGNIDGTS
jgi:hypothetical protein